METLLAWVMLISGLFLGDPAWYIASGIFAVAAQIHHYRMDSMKGGDKQ